MRMPGFFALNFCRLLRQKLEGSLEIALAHRRRLHYMVEGVNHKQATIGGRETKKREEGALRESRLSAVRISERSHPSQRGGEGGERKRGRPHNTHSRWKRAPFLRGVGGDGTREEEEREARK